MRRAAIAFLIAGTMLAAVLIGQSEYGDIIRAFRTLGISGFGVLVCVHLVLIVLMGLAWSVLGDPPWWRFVWGRLVRDGAAEVLPLSQIGGFVLGGRALVLAGASPAFASASTVVDVTLELVAQLFYTLLGLGLLAWLRPGSGGQGPAIASVTAMAVLAGCFVLAQRRGVGVMDQVLTWLGRVLIGQRTPGGPSLREAIGLIHRRPKRLAAGIALHLLAWVLVGGETWIMLRLIGSPIGLGEAIVIDSLLSGLRSMAFMVPQSLGVQEGAYVLLGALFGLPPEAALALSLVRRARDFAIGAPALIAWQVVEGRRAYRVG